MFWPSEAGLLFPAPALTSGDGGLDLELCFLLDYEILCSDAPEAALLWIKLVMDITSKTLSVWILLVFSIKELNFFFFFLKEASSFDSVFHKSHCGFIVLSGVLSSDAVCNSEGAGNKKTL